MPTRGTVASPRQACQYGGSTNPANGLTDEGIGETRSLRGEAINVRCLDQGMTVASEGARRLVIGKEENDVGLLGIQFAKKKKEEAGEAEGSMIHDLIKGMVILSKRRANGNPYGMMNG